MSVTDDAPIIVTGLGRSGTTWMQWFLSQHPRIHIHGQPPGELHWREFWNWYQKLLEHSDWTEQGNTLLDYEIAPYAASDRDRTCDIFKRMFRDYLTGCGPDKPRWGLKWIFLGAHSEQVEQLESLWPETRWVVCLRDPFKTIASAKNTFVPDADLIRWATNWVRTCRFLDTHDPSRVASVQIDKLENASYEERRTALNRVLDCIGEEPTEETDDFIRRWPTVHKVTPDNQRSFTLDDTTKQLLLDKVPDLAHYMKQRGYEVPVLEENTPPSEPASVDPLLNPPPSESLPFNIPSLTNLQGIEHIRHVSQYGNHTLGMLLFSVTYAKCCSRTAREEDGKTEPRRVVEIGFNHGYSAIMLAAAIAESGKPGKVVSIDIRKCEEGQRFLEMQNGLAKRHELVVGDSVKSVDQVLSRLDGPIDLLFIDGLHSYEGCKRDYEAYAPFLAADATLIFHDNYAEGIRRVIDETDGWNFMNLHGWAGLTVGTRKPY